MKTKNKFLLLIPVMLSFFVMGFVDVVGIATNYIKADFHLSDSIANLLGFLSSWIWLKIKMRDKLKIRYVVLIVLLSVVWATQLIPILGEVYAQSVYPVISHFLSSFSKLMPFAIGDLFIFFYINCFLCNFIYNIMFKVLCLRCKSCHNFLP